MPASETRACGVVQASRDEYHVAIQRPSRGILLRQYVYEIGSYHYNWHQEFELLVVLQGEVEVSAGGTIRELAAGDVFVVNSGVSHATLSREPGSLVLLLKLDLCWFDGLYEDSSRLRFDCCSDATTRGERSFVTIRALMAQMMLEAFDDSPAGILRHERHLVALMDELVQAFPPHLEGPVAALGIESRQRAIDRMLAYVDAHYRERITLETLGRESGYNPGYVSQLFTRHLGIGMVDYVTRVRLRQAVRDLVDPSMKVVDVASGNGFPPSARPSASRPPSTAHS